MDAISAKVPPVTDGLPPETRRWAVLAIFTALAMSALDTAIANIALPAIAADLPTPPAGLRAALPNYKAAAGYQFKGW